MQPTLYSDDNTSCSKHLILVVHPTVVSCCVRMASPNGESGIGKAGVCNTWRLTVTSPPIGYSLSRWLWVYEAGEVHSGSHEVWTIGRICDYSHWVHRICRESHFINHNQTTYLPLLCLADFERQLYLDMVTVMLPYTTGTALCSVPLLSVFCCHWPWQMTPTSRPWWQSRCPTLPLLQYAKLDSVPLQYMPPRTGPLPSPK